MRIRRILLATDFSDASEPAVEWAVELAGKFGARLEILHACDLIIAGDVYGAAEVMSLNQQVRTSAKRRLSALVETIRKRGIRASGEIEDGNPAAAILDHAGSADLIVIGTHGRGGVSRLLMGSVAEKVVRAARPPVLTVRAQERPAGASRKVRRVARRRRP